MNSLAVVGTDRDSILHAIEVNTRLGKGTKAQYKREIVKARAVGVNLLDAVAVQDYASTLSKSSRSFLRAALRQWTKRLRLELNSQAHPDTEANRTASIARLSALDEAIETDKSSGTKAHLWLTSKQVKQLINSVKGRTARRDKVVLSLLVGAGLRRDELVNLAWKDVKQQGERTVLEVMGKGDKSRVVPVSGALSAILADWKRFTDGKRTDKVARGLAAGGVLTNSLSGQQVFNIVRKCGKRIGSPELAPHDLRRTYAQIGYDNGVNTRNLQELLGHATLDTTQKYLSLEIDYDVTASDFVPL